MKDRKQKDKQSSDDRSKHELRNQINSTAYSPHERNHQYKLTVMKNPAEKEQAKSVKSQWKSGARSKYGENWKQLARKNGYAV